jgi:hypothetical protein
MPIQNPDLVNRQSSSYGSRDRPTSNASGYPTQSFDAGVPSVFTGLQVIEDRRSLIMLLLFLSVTNYFLKSEPPFVGSIYGCWWFISI